jgi:hypothetical protein
MKQLTEASLGYLNPRYDDGAAIAAAPAYTGSFIILQPLSAHATPVGSTTDPTGSFTVTRPKTGETATIPLTATLSEVEIVMRKLFKTYTSLCFVSSTSSEKRGTEQVCPLPAPAHNCAKVSVLNRWTL